MSALEAFRQGWGTPGLKESAREHSPIKLRSVPRTATRMSRIPFILVLMAIFGLGMAGLLMLNTTLQSQAFQARTLDRQATELAYTQASLERQIDDLRAPQELARRASAMGMRPNPHPAFLVLPEGKVIGKPGAVTGNEVLSLIVKTPAEIAAERKAAEARREAAAAKKATEGKAKAAAAKAKAAAEKTKADEAKKKAADDKAAADKAAADKKKQTGRRG